MAVNISNTKYYKKGERLPDGTKAKRGTAWNTKTNKPLTGKVVMTSAGQGAMSGVKSYKGGRSVASIDRAKARKKAAASRQQTSSSSSSTASDTSLSAAEKARRLRIKQNKAQGAEAGDVKMGRKGKYVRVYNAKTGRWDIPTTESAGALTGVRVKGSADKDKGKNPPPPPSPNRVTTGRSNYGPQAAAAMARNKGLTGSGTSRVLPTNSMSNYSIQRRIDATKKALLIVKSREQRAAANSAARAAAAAERKRLEATLAQLQGR